MKVKKVDIATEKEFNESGAMDFVTAVSGRIDDQLMQFARELVGFKQAKMSAKGLNYNPDFSEAIAKTTRQGLKFTLSLKMTGRVIEPVLKVKKEVD